MSYIGNPIVQAAFVTDTFSGTGSTTAFILSVAPANNAAAFVVISGVVQDPSTYGVVGTTITFSTAPPSGTNNISVRCLGVPVTGVTSTAYRTVSEITATAGQTSFTIPSYTVGFLNVFQNGNLLGSADYTATTGTTVVLATGATVGDLLAFESFNVSSVVNAIQNTGGVITAVNLDTGSSTGTGAVAIPAGTTAQRPTGSNGQFRYNSTTNSFEGFANSAWGAIGGGGGGAGSWQSVQTANFTAIAGNAYPVNTTTSAVTVTLPTSPTAGAYVALVDYARTFAVNNCTINPNGSKLSGSTSSIALTINGESVHLVYLDSTQGWIAYSGFFSSPVAVYTVSYLVAAGGGAGGSCDSGNNIAGGGGGAGGLLLGTTSLSSGSSYAITIGAGGAGAVGSAGSGSNTSFGSVVSVLGGGRGAGYNAGTSYYASVSGGSGGGGAYSNNSGAAGTAGQGYAGGNGTNSGPYPAAGGGGSASVGASYSGGTGGAGGSATTSTISGTSASYAGGGGGGGGAGGAGGGGGAGAAGAAGSSPTNGNNASANSGSGGGGAGGSGGSVGSASGGSGGSGIVIISYAGPQRATGGAITTSGGNTIHTFTSSGTFTA